MDDPKWMGIMAGTAIVSALCSVVIALTAVDISRTVKSIEHQQPTKTTACKLT